MRGCSPGRHFNPAPWSVVSLLAVLAFSASAAGGSPDAVPATTAVDPLTEWIQLGRDAGQGLRACANRKASGVWSVEATAGIARISPYRQPPSFESRHRRIPGTAEFAGMRHGLQVERGLWLGVDRGEFGGGLWWFPAGGGPRRRVSQENVHGFETMGGTIWALTGLDHLGLHTGALIAPGFREDGSPRMSRIVPLPGTPKAYTLRDDGLWIVTSKAVLRFDGDRVQRVHGVAYQSLYPNSIVVDAQGRIFIGMRHLVVRLTKSRRGYHEDWFVPPSCAVLDIKTCTCTRARTATEN